MLKFLFINLSLVNVVQIQNLFSSPGTNVLGEVLSYPGVFVGVVVVGADNFRLKFLFINLSQVKVSVY